MSTTTQRRRAVTSAISELGINQIRLGLAEIRKTYAEASPEKLFYGSDVLSSIPEINMTKEDFSLRFVMGHHTKRRKVVGE